MNTNQESRSASSKAANPKVAQQDGLDGPYTPFWEDGRCWIRNVHGRRLVEVVCDGVFANHPGGRARVAIAIVDALNGQPSCEHEWRVVRALDGTAALGAGPECIKCGVCQ